MSIGVCPLTPSYQSKLLPLADQREKVHYLVCSQSRGLLVSSKKIPVREILPILNRLTEISPTWDRNRGHTFLVSFVILRPLRFFAPIIHCQLIQICIVGRLRALSKE